MVARHLPPEYTGAGQQALTLARCLSDKINIFAVCEQGRQKPGKEIVDGVEIHRLKTYINRSEFGIGKIIYAINLFFFLIKNNNQYDIIHCIGSSFIVLPAFIAAKLFKKKVSVKLTLAGKDGDDPDALKRRNIGKIVYQALQRIDAIICVSQQLYDICRRHGIPEEKLYKIPNGVDTDLFKPMQKSEKLKLRKQLGLPKNDLIVCFTGKTGRRKRIDLAVKTVANALNTYPNLFLSIIGPKDIQDIDFIKYVKYIIESSGILGKIRFTGFLEFHEAGNFMRASDIFLLPSSSEGLPNALLEAMACGLCCVVADKPPMNFLIQNNHNGFVVNPENMDEFKHIIERFVNNSSDINNIGVTARRYIENTYAINQIADKYLQLYRKINF